MSWKIPINATFAYAGMAVIIFLMACSSGCLSYGYFYNDSTYDVSITGLSNYTGNGTSIVYLPAPVVPDQQIVADFDMANTEHGKMYVFYQNNTTLTDLHRSTGGMHFFASSDASDKVMNLSNHSMEVYGQALKPVSTESSGIYTQWRKDPADTINYTSYVYIDPNITPVAGRDTNLTVKLHLKTGIGQEARSESVIDYNLYVDECIPAGVRGWIPVTVQVEHTTLKDL